MLIQIRDFFKKYDKKFVDFDGKYGNQCVDLFRAYVNEVLGFKQPGGVNGAKDLYDYYDRIANMSTQFTKIKNTPKFVPILGDVMIWNSKYGEYGHVAICTGFGDTNMFEAFSQNDPAKSPCILKKYTYTNVSGVLRPNKLIA